MSQEGALACIVVVTGVTSLEWPYHTLLVVCSVIGLNDECGQCVERFTWASVKCSDTDIVNVGHYRQGQKLDYMCEPIASVGSLYIANLPTVNADTREDTVIICLFFSIN